MERALVVGAVALVALSGCSGLTGEAEFAPGVTGERVVNVTALSGAQTDVLANVSYTFTRNASQRIGADGPGPRGLLGPLRPGVGGGLRRPRCHAGLA